MRQMKWMWALGCIVLGSSASANDLLGTWGLRDDCANAGDGTYLKLTAVFRSDMTMTITAGFFVESTCSDSGDSTVMEGTYKIGNPSTVVKGAVDLDIDWDGPGVLYSIYLLNPSTGDLRIGDTTGGTDDGTTAARRHQGLLGEPFVFVRK